MCIGWDTGSCHNPGSECNQCRSNEPHIFHLTWCADTRGFVGLSCDLDLGYRSAQGARHGLLQYSTAGLGSGDADFRNASTVTFPDSPFAFDHFAVDSGKNDILTVFQLSMAEGNDDGDDLALTQSAGFCCRATLWGGKTTTGTLYIGDLTIRANGLTTDRPPPVPPAPAPGYSGGAVSGAALGGALLGGVAAVAGLAALQYRATGALPSFGGAGYARVPGAATACSCRQRLARSSSVRDSALSKAAGCCGWQLVRDLTPGGGA